MKYLFVAAFIAVYLFYGLELGYANHSPFHTHLTYMFQHASVMHLALNSIAFIGMFHALRKFIGRWRIAAAILLCGFAASSMSVKAIPTVGASSMIYAMIGMYVGMTLLCPQIKIADTRKYLLFISCVGIGLLVSLLKANSNFLVHVYSLAMGFAVSVPFALRGSSCVIKKRDK